MVLPIYDAKNAHFGACSLFHVRGTLDVDGVSWNSPADYIYRGMFPPNSPENASLLTLKDQNELSKKFKNAYLSREKSLIRESAREYVSAILDQIPDARKALANTGDKAIIYESQSDAYLGAKISKGEVISNDYEIKEFEVAKRTVADENNLGYLQGLISEGRVEYVSRQGSAFRRKIIVKATTTLNVGDTVFVGNRGILVSDENIQELQETIRTGTIKVLHRGAKTKIKADDDTIIEVGDTVIFYPETVKTQAIASTGVKRKEILNVDGLNILGTTLESFRKQLFLTSKELDDRYRVYIAYTALTTQMLEGDDPFIDQYYDKAKTARELQELLAPTNLVTKEQFIRGAYEYPYGAEQPTANDIISIVIHKNIDKAKKLHEDRVVRKVLIEQLKQTVFPRVYPDTEPEDAYHLFLKGISGSKLKYMHSVVRKNINTLYARRLYSEVDIEVARSHKSLSASFPISTKSATSGDRTAAIKSQNEHIIISDDPSYQNDTLSRFFSPIRRTDIRLGNGVYPTMSHFIKIDTLYTKFSDTLKDAVMPKISAAYDAMVVDNFMEWHQKIDSTHMKCLQLALIERCKMAVFVRFSNPMFAESLLVTGTNKLVWNDPFDVFLNDAPANFMMEIRDGLQPSQDKLFLDAFVWNYTDHMLAQVRYAISSIAKIFPWMTKSQTAKAAITLLGRDLNRIDAADVFPPEWLQEANDDVREFVMNKVNVLGVLEEKSIDNKFLIVQMADYLVKVANTGISSGRYGADAIITICELLRKVSGKGELTLKREDLVYVYALLLGKSHRYASERLKKTLTSDTPKQPEQPRDEPESDECFDVDEYITEDVAEDEGISLEADDDTEHVEKDYEDEEDAPGEDELEDELGDDEFLFGTDETFDSSELTNYVITTLRSKFVHFDDDAPLKRLIQDIQILKTLKNRTLSARIAFYM